jgi:hypothetical protein
VARSASRLHRPRQEAPAEARRARRPLAPPTLQQQLLSPPPHRVGTGAKPRADDVPGVVMQPYPHGHRRASSRHAAPSLSCRSMAPPSSCAASTNTIPVRWSSAARARWRHLHLHQSPQWRYEPRTTSLPSGLAVQGSFLTSAISVNSTFHKASVQPQRIL